MKNIVFISTYDVPCGIAEYTKYLAESLKNEDTNVYIFAESKYLCRQENYVSNGINVYRVWSRSAPYNSQYGLSSIVNMIRGSEVKPDVIHIQHEFGIFPDNEGLYKLIEEFHSFNIQCYITLHTVSQPPLNIGFFNRLNTYLIEKIVHTYAANTVVPSAHVIPHGVFELGGKQRNSDDGDVNFLFPGFISPSKNHAEVIEAFANAWSSECSKLHIVGMCRNTEYLNKLKSQIRGFSLENDIIIDEGFKTTEEMNKYLRESDVVILGNGKTSPFSASGQLAQAIGAQLTILAKNVPIYRSQKSDKILYFTEKKECSEYIKALVKNPELRQTLGRHNRSDYQTWDKVANTHKFLYNRSR